MKFQIVGKLAAALLLVALLTLLLQHSFNERRQMSREDFLAKQGERYDRLARRPIPAAVTFTVSFILLGVVFTTYELIGLGVAKIAESAGGRDQAG